MPDRKQPDDAKDLPLASEHELRREPPPARADALDQMRRRLDGTPRAPEQPTSVAPEEEEEGHHADPAEGRAPIDDGLEREFPNRGRE